MESQGSQHNSVSMFTQFPIGRELLKMDHYIKFSKKKKKTSWMSSFASNEFDHNYGFTEATKPITQQIFFRFFAFSHHFIVLTLVAKKMGFCVFPFSHHFVTKVSNEK